MKNKGFTLLELMIVIVILGILIGLGIPAYQKTVRQAQDKEAKSMLLLIRAAEKVKMIEIGFYVWCAWGANCRTAECNDLLGLDLSSQTWEYSIPPSDRFPTDFCAQATALDEEKGAGTGDWYIKKDFTVAQRGNCSRW